MTFLLQPHALRLDQSEAWIGVLSNSVIGISCVVAVGVLSHSLRKIRNPPGRLASISYGAMLATAGAAHLARAAHALPDQPWANDVLQVSRAMCALSAVVLLHQVMVRIASLVDRERVAQRRETDLTSVLDDVSTSYSRLRDLAEVKTQVFANVSHELRTPLTLILGPVQALLEAAETSSEQRTALSIVERNAQLLLGHVNDLLELSRADAVGVQLNTKPTDPAALLDSLAQSFRPLALELGIDYQTDIERKSTTLLLDAGKLERICMNLLANAFKFTPQGGKVSMRLTIEHSASDHLSGAQLLLTVDDSGPGIRASDRERIFERFRQLDGKPNRAFSGTGLGLAIVREFVDVSAGTICVEDSALGGARFVVRLPVEVSDPSADLDPEPEAFPQSSSSAEMLALRARPLPGPEATATDLPLVFVVEDNADMNRFVCSSLSAEFMVLSAFDGAQALARLETLNPDLIVTDFMMPHMSGDEFVHALRRRPALMDVPVLVLTARDEIELRVRVLSDGVQDWLTKPFTVRELVARARNLVSARRARTILRAELATREFDVGELADQLAQRKRQLETMLESLTQALQHAEVASRFKTSLLRLVSHELRTPLGALQLQLERLSAGHRGALNEGQEQLMVRMRRSLSRLTETIQSLLEYARIESGRLDLSVQRFDVVELARSVVEDFWPQADQKGLKLSLVAPVHQALFDSDAHLIRLVLVNLVANALKFTQKGEIAIGAEVESDHCELYVTDTGPGIEPRLQTAVFEPFFQGEAANHQQYSQGAGLGLCLVREMLNALGGRVELESELGRGSTFRIRLPRAELPTSSALEEPARNIA